MDDYDLLVAKIDDRLSADQFRLWRGVSINESLDTDLFATRIRWIVGRNSEHVFVQFRSCSIKRWTMQSEHIRTSLPITLWTNYRVICCIATTNVTPQLIRCVTQRPGQHWDKRTIHGYYQLPVLIDLENNQTYWYHGLFCRGLRQMVAQYIAV